MAERKVSQETKSSERLFYADILRVAAIGAVIVLHVSAIHWYSLPPESLTWQILNLYNSLALWGVPIFVMLSGMLHLRKEQGEDDFCAEMKKLGRKILKLVCALVFWGILYNAISLVSGYVSGGIVTVDIKTLLAPLTSVVFGPAWYHLWYLYMLIGLYLLTPILRCFIRSAKKEHVGYFLLLFFAGTCVNLYNTVNGAFPHVGITFLERDFYPPIPEMISYVGYYVAGYYFNTYGASKKFLIAINVLAVVGLVFMTLGDSLFSVYAGVPHQELAGNMLPNSVLVAFAVFLDGKHFLQRAEEKSLLRAQPQNVRKRQNVLSCLSGATFGVYLIHALVLSTCLSIFDVLALYPVIAVPLYAVAVFLLSLACTLFIKRIPFLGRYIV
jgi:surface polysaccharide O-acyltransferase-like enzyme